MSEITLSQLMNLCTALNGSKSAPCSQATKFQIVVLDRGFVYVGDVALDGDWVVVANAKNIRVWGTSKGLGQLALGNQGQQLGFYAGQRAQDFNELMGGAQLYNMGTNGFWNPLNNANNIYGGYTGFGTNTSNSSAGGGWGGLLGGMLAGGSLANNFGWWK